MEAADKYKAIVIGASAGGFAAIGSILEHLPATYRLPVIIVQHRIKDQRELLEELLQNRCNMPVKQADEKEKIEDNHVYLAPPDYHLLIESDRSFSLTVEQHVHFSRPSIDVLFESAAAAYGSTLVGIILTGANGDGAQGMLAIKRAGGCTIAQDPEEASYPAMPLASIHKQSITQVMKLEEIKTFLLTIGTPA